jgi:hypothetical protein
MKKKLGTCVAAALTIFAGATHLAASVELGAAEILACTAVDAAYAQGYADGDCRSDGYTGGHVTSCNSTTGEFTYNCYST